MQISKMPTSWPVARLMRGDENTCEIKMRVKRFADGVDLGGLAWMLAIKNAKGETDARHLAAMETEEEIELRWLTGGVATKEAGETHVWISGFDGETKIWNSEKYKIEIADREEMPVPDETRNELTEIQQLILYVDKELQGVIEAGRMAREAAQNPPQIGKNGNWHIYDAEKKEYVDSGKPSVGGGSGGGSGKDGEDGGYYVPSVDEQTGELSWAASKADMPEAPSANIKGPKGDRGEPGPKGDTGDTGPQGPQGEPGADAVPYTLPPATADTLGGVKVGEGLEVDANGKVRAKSEGDFEVIKVIHVEEEVGVVNVYEDSDNKPIRLSAVSLRTTFETCSYTGNVSVKYLIEGDWNKEISSYILNPYNEKLKKYGYGKAYLSNGRWRSGWWTAATGHAEYAQYYENPVQQEKYGKDDGYVTKISITHVTGIPLGSVIEVWGVRA